MKDGKVYRSHKSSGAKRPYTPAAPTKAPTNPTRSAGVVPEGTEGSTPPLNETKEVEDASEPSVNDPPRPPPVKFAPLGYDKKQKLMLLMPLPHHHEKTYPNWT